MPLLQAGYRSFIQLKDTPNYKELFKNQPYAMRKDPLWRDDTRNKRKELEKVAFYHCDQVGTPQTLSNERGECIWKITQNTWGKALKIQAIDDLLEQSHLRFQGQYYDEETGLHYNNHRYYEPYSARYISKDPIGLDGGLNSSIYVRNPNQWVDQLGLNISYGGQLLGMSQQASSNLEYQAYRNYDCWLATGNICTIKVQPLFDYVICSGGASIGSYSKIYNLHNGNIYTAGGISATSLKNLTSDAKTIGDIAQKTVDKSFNLGASSLGKLGKMFSASCMAGYIINKPKGLKVAQATDEFLTGMGISQSIGWYGLRVGVSVPAGSFFDRNGPAGIEVGVGTPGVDISVSDSQPTLVRSQN